MLCGFKSFGFAFVFLSYPQTQLVNSCEHYEVAYFLIAFCRKKIQSKQISHIFTCQRQGYYDEQLPRENRMIDKRKKPPYQSAPLLAGDALEDIEVKNMY